jgi:hypothetical protein
LLDRQVKDSPFLSVTNRDFSLFLWENPQFMRVNTKNKTGYLPGFEYVERVGLNPEMAEQYVIAPPELIYHYHLWNRLLGDQKATRSISPEQFRTFLDQAPEWSPRFWPDAPQGYVELIADLDLIRVSDMQLLPESQLPQVVRRAFVGWLNYFHEGDAINSFTPTYAQVEALIKANPHYARNYWRNLLIDTAPKYLESFARGGYSPETIVPADELAPFLKVALFNASK